MDSAYMKYSTLNESGEETDKFSTPFLSVAIVSLILSGIIILFRGQISVILEVPAQYSYLFYYVAGILFFDAVSALPFIRFRLQRRAKIFAFFKILNILLVILLNLFLILGLKSGIEAVFISNLAASGFSFALLLPSIVKGFKLRINKNLFDKMIKFGLPYLPAGLASMVIQGFDRPILTHLTDLETNGIYQANHKLGIIMMLYINMFQYAWQPFFLQNAKEKNAKDIFSKVLTYFTIGGSFILIFFSLFVEDIVKLNLGIHIIGASYWSGLYIVPVILIAYLFNGLYFIFSAGIYIEEKSIYVPFITGLGAVVNIITNFLLIPVWGIMGAAVALLFSYITLAGGIYVVTQKFYKINYETGKLIRLFSGIFLIFLMYYMLLFSGYLSAGIKIFLLLLFITYVAGLVLDRKEISYLKKSITRKENGTH
jgi:O-antigen/teichoic acid export membrane protein